MRTTTDEKTPASLAARRPGLPVDPRIRRRQIDVRRAQGRRRLRVALTIAASVALLSAAWGTTRSPLLDVDRLVVDGAVHTPESVVQAAASVAPGEAMTDVDRTGAARRLSRLPWVLWADVRRDWPATVRVRLVERTPIAVTRDDAGDWALVDRTGRVLERAAAPPPGLPVVEGVPAAGVPGSRLSAVATDTLEVAAQLPPGLAPRVVAVALGSAGVELRLRPQGVVLVGTAEGAGDKLQAAHTVLGAVDGRTVATLDVRVPNTPVLTRQ